MTTPVWDYFFLRRVEAALNARPFHGVALGPSLDEPLYIDLHKNSRGHRYGLRSAALDVARLARAIVSAPPAPPWPRAPLPKGRVLFDYTTAEPRILAMILPILEALGRERCLVVCRVAAANRALPAGTASLGWDEVPVDGPAWRAEALDALPAWARALRSCHVPPAVAARMLLHAATVSRHPRRAEVLLDAAEPAVVLTDNDRSPCGAALVQVARRRRIPTVSLVHGVVNLFPGDRAPHLADRVLAWGELMRDALVAQGTPPGVIRVAGCTRITRELTADRDDVRRRLGLDGRFVVLLGTNPVEPELRHALVREVVAAMARLEGAFLLVRIHPSEQASFYASDVDGAANVRVLPNDALGLDESFAAADAVVVNGSGLGGDALVKRRPVIVYDGLDMPANYRAELVEQAGCPAPRSPEALAAVLASVRVDAGERARLAALAEAYVARFCAAFGADAARRVAAEVDDARSSRDPSPLTVQP